MITRREIQEQINHLKVPVDVSFTTFLDASAPEDIFDCCNVTEHIFVSAIIVHLLSRKVLLLHHRTLDQWVLPGGHLDFNDKSVVEAVYREVQQETGLTKSQLIPMNAYKGLPYCVEINSRLIPYRPDKKREAHVHYDFAFVFGYAGDKELDVDIYEHAGYKWFPVEDTYVKHLFNVSVDDVVIAGVESYEEEIREAQKNDYLTTPLAWYQCNVAESCLEQGQTDRAEQMYLSAIKSFKNTYNDEYETPPYILNAIWRLANLYGQSGRIGLKLRYLEEGIAISKMNAGWDSNFEKMVSMFQKEKEETSQT